MNNLNFNELKSVKTPDRWIENAVNIPKMNKKPMPFYLNHRFIGSVACLVICCALSLMVYFGLSNNAPVPVVPDDKTSASQDSTSVNPSNNTLSESQNSDTINPSVANQFNIHTSQPLYRADSSAFGSTTPSNSSASSSSSVDSTQSNNNSVATIPVITEPPEVPVITEPQTTYPDDSPAIVPTTEFTTNPGCDYNPDEPLTALPQLYFERNIYFTPKKNSAFLQYDNLYCHIASASGEVYSEKFSSVEKVNKTIIGDSFKSAYNPKINNIYLTYGNYTLTFYDERGNSLTYTCYIGDEAIYLYEY